MVSEPAGSREVAFRVAYPIGDVGEVALEDYARVLARAEDAVVLRHAGDPAMIQGVRITGATAPLSEALVADLEAFARDLARAAGESGLGWS